MSAFVWPNEESVLKDIVFAELEKNLEALFAQVCAIDCGCALLRFLDENPHQLLTIDDIAYHLKDAYSHVESGLRAMVELGLARRIDVAGIALFGMSTELERRQLIRNLCAWQDRWHARLEQIERLIGKKVTHFEA